jgi:dipeptidyl aminopeptidase/acylaminoacyl peptidase
MKRTLCLWAAAAACAFAAPAPASAAPPPVEAFFQKPLFSSATLSPDGHRVAFLVGSATARTRLAVLDLDTMKPQVLASYDESDVRRVWWVNDQRLVFDLETPLTGLGRIDAGPGLYGVDADGSDYRGLIEIRPSFVKAPPSGIPLLPWNTGITDVPGRATGDDIFVARAQEVSREKIDYFLIQRLNTRNGRATELEVPLHTIRWALDTRGEVRAVLTAVGTRRAMHLRQADGSWKQLAEFEDLGSDGMVPLWVGPDDTLYVSAPAGDKAAVFVLDAATGKPQPRPLAASPDFDLHPQFIANDRKLLGLRYTVDAEVTQWLDPEMRALQDKVDQLLPASGNRLSVPRHGDAPWVLVQAFADTRPLVTYAFNRSTGKLTRLSTPPADLDTRQMGQTDFVRYRARDGRSIPAYLTLPAGGGKQLPLVVLVHGGPWVRGRSWNWDPEVQFLASRGYAVLQPEYRGSAGFGFEHMAAGFKQWGAAMQDDVADAALWAVAQGHADPARICIAGASYGGYATLMGLARDPDLFRCGIAWAAVTDLMLRYGTSWSNITEQAKKYGLGRMVGDPVADAAALKAASPLNNATRIKQPLLLAHGGWDTVVPLIHGEDFLAAVKPNNPGVEWVVYPDEGHGWTKPANNIDFWTRVERFLDKNIGKAAVH